MIALLFAPSFALSLARTGPTSRTDGLDGSEHSYSTYTKLGNSSMGALGCAFIVVKYLACTAAGLDLRCDRLGRYEESVRFHKNPSFLQPQGIPVPTIRRLHHLSDDLQQRYSKEQKNSKCLNHSVIISTL